MKNLRIALAQINPTVGDLEGNRKKIVAWIKKAKKRKAELVVFPELAITGYPPKDLLLKNGFVEKNILELKKIIPFTKKISVIVGFAEKKGNKLFNAAAVISNGKFLGTQYKACLPNYDVYDEKRYFQPGKNHRIFKINGTKIGVCICEDIWESNEVVAKLKKTGAELVVNISASPYRMGKTTERKELVAKRAKTNKTPLIYCNMAGGQDDMVFDGNSMIANAKGKIIALAQKCKEDLIICGLNGKEILETETNLTGEIFDVLALGLHDYAKKNGFKKIVLGMSGGIDSSVSAAIAVKALGKENVLGLWMPSRISSGQSGKDAGETAKNLGIKMETIPIVKIVQSYGKTMKKEFGGTKTGIAEQNIQARARGNILMALSNKFKYLVLSTGNKSELAVGYATLYGDMAGGFAVLSDVPKTLVYALADYINFLHGKMIIPESILKKEPTAELRKGQLDRDDLPPYDVLDKILYYYIEKRMGKKEIIGKGFDRKTVEKVMRMVGKAEYKRKQATIGIKITKSSFTTGWRMPITNKYRQ